MSHLTNYERETIINFNEAEGMASVYTHNKALRRRLEQLAQERPEECKLFKVTRWGEAVEYYIPKSWIKVSPPRKLHISEEQRAANRARLEKARLAQKATSESGKQEHDRAGEGRDTTPTPEHEGTARE